MTYQRHDEIEAEIGLNGEDVPVCIVFTAMMYADGSGASSVFIENVINIETDEVITNQLKAADKLLLADWIRSKQG